MSNETTLDDVLALVPSNWCDPMLTGPDAVLAGHGGTWGCPDVERLLSAVRKRLHDSPELRAALEDARRLDALQKYVDEAREGMLLLHNGNGAGRGILGLGLANVGRTLREAVDASLLMDEQFAAAKAIPAIDAMAAGGES